MCGRPPSACRLAAGAVLLLVLAGCGGAAPAGDPAPPLAPAVQIFHDDFFDETVSAEKWIPSEPDFAVDPSTGTMALTDEAVTTSAPAFERGDGELEVHVHMAWPAWCSIPSPHASRPLQLVALDTSAVVASLVVTANTDCTTVVEYRIDPTGTVSPSSVANPQTWQPFDLADGIHEYRIHILDDGRATWYRDGMAMITSLVPLSDRGYVLRLEGIGSADAPPVVYDDVEVLQR